MRYKDLSDTLKKKCLDHNQKIANGPHRTLEKGTDGSFWYLDGGSLAGESTTEPNRPPFLTGSCTLFLLMPDRLTVAEVDISTALSRQAALAHHQAHKESTRLKPYSIKGTDNHIPVVNSKRDIVGYQVVPETVSDSQLLGRNGRTWRTNRGIF